MQSLRLKWMATLLLTGLVGVVLVGLFTYRTTVSEYDRLRVEQALTWFISDVAAYYEDHQEWDDFETWVLQNRLPPGVANPFIPRQFFALADTDGIVVAGYGPFHAGQRLAPQQVAEGIPIMVDGQRVATALLALPPPALDPREQRYLDSTNQALFIGAVGAILVALLIGLLLSRHFLHPLTELTRAITAMKQGDLNQQVEVRTQDELGRLAQTFNQMSAEIHRANQIRRQMSADIAHDLRTPLMVITGYLEALRDGTLQPNQERFETMYQESLLLRRLVEDLRTLSLADAGELKLVCQPVQPGELLQQVRQSFEPLAAEQQVTLRLETDAGLPDLQVDRDRMAGVLENLLSNALRYTPAGGIITLRARRHPGGVQLVVSDNGVGIPDDKLPHIFERFYRIEESRHQRQDESGLGLAIAKSIVEAHRGVIAAESRPGDGTSIIITL